MRKSILGINREILLEMEDYTSIRSKNFRIFGLKSSLVGLKVSQTKNCLNQCWAKSKCLFWRKPICIVWLFNVKLTDGFAEFDSPSSPVFHSAILGALHWNDRFSKVCEYGLRNKIVLLWIVKILAKDSIF
jgi:hypothetical protein